MCWKPTVLCMQDLRPIIMEFFASGLWRMCHFLSFKDEKNELSFIFSKFVDLISCQDAPSLSLFCPLFDSQWLKSSLHSGPTCACCCSGWEVNINIGYGSLSRFPDPALYVCSFNLIFFKVLQDILLSKVGTLMFILPRKEMFISRLNLENAMCLV